MNTTNHRRLITEKRKPIIDLRKPTIDMPLHIYVISLLFLAMATICIGWVVAVWQDIPVSNPFSEYANIFPGHSEEQVMAQGFNCNKYYFPWDESNLCSLMPKQGPFQEISVITMDSTVYSVTFSMRKNAITVGDLAFLWGRPKSQFFYQLGIFTWPTDHIRAYSHTTNKQPSYYQTVDNISFWSSK
jgi:hypothetical protein